MGAFTANASSWSPVSDFVGLGDNFYTVSLHRKPRIPNLHLALYMTCKLTQKCHVSVASIVASNRDRTKTHAIVSRPKCHTRLIASRMLQTSASVQYLRMCTATRHCRSCHSVSRPATTITTAMSQLRLRTPTILLVGSIRTGFTRGRAPTPVCVCIRAVVYW